MKMDATKACTTCQNCGRPSNWTHDDGGCPLCGKPRGTPPIAAPAAHVERRKVEVGQRRKSYHRTYTVFAIEGRCAFVCQDGDVDSIDGYVHNGGCCWESVSVLEDCELLADATPEPAKCECGAGRNHVMYGVCKLAAKTAEDLTFEQFAEVNRRRCESYNGFGESLQLSSQYTEAHWALSIASEAGEVADAILGWSGLKRSKAGKTKEDVGRELADVVTYCDLLASKLGFQLSRLIVAKFNEINERCGFGNRFAIGSHPVQPALEAKDSDRCARADCGREAQ